MTPKNPTVAVIGFGGIGRNHVRNLSVMGDVDIVGVVDTSSSARARAEELGYRTYSDVSELLKQPPNGAIVAVPTGSHYAVATQLIDAGISLLIEKPIASSLEQGQDLIDRCRKRALPLMVGYVERFNPAIITAQRLMQDGLIGAPLQIATRRLGPIQPRVEDANVIVDIAVHDIDIISFLLQTNLTLVSAQGGMATINDRIDYAVLALDAGGVVATVAVNWFTPIKVRDLTITGSNGYLQIDYLKQQAHFAPGRNFVASETYENMLAQYEDGKLVECPVIRREPLSLELERFVRILHGGEYPSPEMSLQSLRIALEATAVIESGLKVEA